MQLEDRPKTPTSYKPKSTPPIRTSRLVKHPHEFLFDNKALGQDTGDALKENTADFAMQPTLKLVAMSPATSDEFSYASDEFSYEELDQQLIPDLETHRLNAMELMQLSGMLQAVQVPASGNKAAPMPAEWEEKTRQLTGSMRAVRVQQMTGSMRAISPQESATLEKTHLLNGAQPVAPQPGWKTFLNKPIVKGVMGVLIGLCLLVLVSRMVDIPMTIDVLKKNLATPQGALYAVLTMLAFIASWSVRGVRWKMFLRPITNVSVIKVIQIYWIGVFINVVLPVQGGEVAKSLMLKNVAGVPVSQSLPSVAMDKALDLMPALVIMAVVPFIPGIHMNAVLWGMLALVGGILIGVIFVVALTAWKRAVAVSFIQFMVGLLPKKIGGKIEGFAMGFVDSLLAGASNPKNFIPAVFLTAAALACDGLFAMFAFWTVGMNNVNFGMASFGYTTFNMFMILPTPPGHVGTNELFGTIVFGDLLGFDKKGVLAMFVFSHPLTAVIMAGMALICLSALGLKISSALKSSPADERPGAAQPGAGEASERQMAAMV